MPGVITDRRQGITASAAVKVPCKAATTANITLSGEQTIDGVACTSGDRVLVKDQTNPVDNGIWIVGTGTWQRSPDLDGSLDVRQGTFVYVSQGSTNIGFWYVETANPIIPGTTSLSIIRASSVLAGISAFMQDFLNDADAGAAMQTLNGVQVVNTVATLRTIAPNTSRKIWLAYHTTPGDGGHGMFRAVTGAALGTYVDNGGTIIVPTDGDGSAAFLREYSGAVFPHWFGAAGDGTTDDSTAFAAMPSGSKVDLGGDTFLIGSNISISGEFENGTIKLSSTAAIVVSGAITLNCAVTLTNSHRGAWLTADSIDGIRFGDQFVYDGNTSGIGTITTTADKSEAKISNCTAISAIGATFRNSNGTPLVITDCSDITLIGNVCENSLGLAAYGGTGVQTNAFARFQRCEDIVAVGNRGRLIDDNVFAGIGIRRAVISQNEFEDVRFLTIIHNDAALSCDDVVVADNIVKGCESGIALGWWDGAIGYPCTGVTIKGNRLHSGVTAAATAWSKKYGIRYRYSTTDCIVADNHIESTLETIIASTVADANLPNDSVTGIKYHNNKFVTGVDGATSPVCVLEDTGGSGNEYVSNTIEVTAYVAGSVQPVNVGENTIFKTNTVSGTTGYGESVFRAGSVVRGNTFDTIGAYAGTTTYELIDNDFINGANINEAGTAVKISGNRGATNGQHLFTNRIVKDGTGSPEGVVTAVVGSLYMRRDGGAGTSLYVKESGTGNTGWVAK